ncbi:hypothetical protein RLIN73S_01122 [Rhodanobacter lindaniclasticus]
MPALLTRIETAPEFLRYAIDQAFDGRTVGDVQHAAVATVCGQPLTDRGGAALAGGRADHGGAQRRQLVRDGGANAATGAGDQRDFTLQWIVHVFGFLGERDSRFGKGRQTRSGPAKLAYTHSVRAASSSAGVPMARASMLLSMRLIRPDNTLPGPHSATRVAPPAASACTHSVQRTGRYN